MNKWLAELPTTNARIALSLMLATLTGIRVMFFGWEPSWEWLTFLSVWAGLDVLQYGAKRATYRESPPNTQDVEDNAAEPSPTHTDERGDL